MPVTGYIAQKKVAILKKKKMKKIIKIYVLDIAKYSFIIYTQIIKKNNYMLFFLVP
jgi:hypothetical protein